MWGEIRMRLALPTRYACYYGMGRLVQLAAYNLVILQAAHYTPPEIASLEAAGTRTFAYLSLGEAFGSEAEGPWQILDPDTGRPMVNLKWGTGLVDCRSLLWQDHVLEELVPRLLGVGFSGLFLDTVDVQDRVADTRPGVEQLMRRIRAAYPETGLLVNRGFTVLETVREVADGVVFEAFTSHYDGTRYRSWLGADLAWTMQRALELRATFDRHVLLALDYAAPGDHALRAKAIKRALAHGFVPFVTNHRLDTLP